jgi:hypothetical protein
MLKAKKEQQEHMNNKTSNTTRVMIKQVTQPRFFLGGATG